MKIKLGKLFISALIFTVSVHLFADNETSRNSDKTVNTVQSENTENMNENKVPVKTETQSSSLVKKSKAVSTLKKKDISNSLWRLTDLGEKNLSHEETENGKTIITLYLSSNGGINGVAGENGYFGNYRLNGNNISINLIGSSFSDEASEIEGEYLNILEKVSSAELNGNILTLKSGRGTLTFERVK
ncbi:MAG: META domain-containing protein [Leptotrichiaceae bacterium]|nr:META domain-containing protein [Leptotrichiaceae bacterium]